MTAANNQTHTPRTVQELLMVRALILSLVALFFLAPAAHAEIFWQLSGSSQGSIGGTATLPGEVGNIEVASLSFGFTTSGVGGGGSQPETLGTLITISKAWDPSSVNIAAALGNQELLSTCTFRLYSSVASAHADGSAGRMPTGYDLQIELIGARIETHSVAGGEPFENISIVYDEIRITHEPSGDLFVWDAIGAPRALPLDAAKGPVSPWDTANPFEFIVSAEGTVDIDVTDSEGRPVRSLGFSDRASHSGTVVWDATDDAGRTVEPGIYIATQRTDGQEITRRIVIGH